VSAGDLEQCIGNGKNATHPTPLHWRQTECVLNSWTSHGNTYAIQIGDRREKREEKKYLGPLLQDVAGVRQLAPLKFYKVKQYPPGASRALATAWGVYHALNWRLHSKTSHCSNVLVQMPTGIKVDVSPPR